MKETRIALRATVELKQRLKRICDETGISESALVVSCIEALADYFDEHQEITMPLAVLPKSKLKTQAPIANRKTA